ncbi:MAG TPA: sigma-E factor regulatory protein RseB domain-containing protein, partial [Mycobacteriales bacterium]|nr:sigma-E factor regulatory protein RseB domain-containing protein [Mycobacteriales bacterium]
MKQLPLWLAVGGCSAALLTPARAVLPAPGAPGAAAVVDATGDGLLEAAARAAEALDYQGTQFVGFWSESGSTSAIVEVSHVAGEGAVMRIEPTPQNPAGSVYRSGGEGAPEVVGFDPATLALLHRNFEAAITGSDSVAGRPTDVVAVRRPGESPVARFWLDRDTRLVLRREVLDGDGRTLRASAFVRVSFGTARSMSPDGAERTPQVAGERLDDAAMDELADDGWRLPSRLPEGVELFDARRTGRGADEQLHLTYSDGVSTLSLFQQRGRLDTGSLDGFRRIKVGDTGA